MYFGGVELNGHVWTKRRWGRGNRSACLWVWIFECSMWWVVARHDETRVRKRGKGEGWAGASRGSQCIRLNGCQVGGVMCGRGGGHFPALETDATLVRLHFPSPNTKEHANPSFCVCGVLCEHHTLDKSRTCSIRSQPNLFAAVFSSFCSFCSKAYSSLQQREKVMWSRERERERRARWRKSSVTFGSVLHYWLWLMWSEEITEIQYSHKSPTRLVHLTAVSLLVSHVGTLGHLGTFIFTLE